MFCTTECWNCEDKKCEHYVSKQDLYFENLQLKQTLNEIRKKIDEFDLGKYDYSIPVFVLQEILDEIKERERI